VIDDDDDGGYDGNDDDDDVFSELLILQYTSWHDTSTFHKLCC